MQRTRADEDQGLEEALTPEADADLDQLLTGWAARHQLPQSRSERIRETVLLASGDSPEDSEELTREWWRNFSGQLRQSLRQSLNAWRDVGVPA